MKERWKAVVGFEGLYEVSDQGRVRSLDRCDSIGRKLRGKVLRPGILPNNSGNAYHTISLCRNARVRQIAVHAVVLAAFVGPRPKGYQAAHYDRNGTNNRIKNLSWKTPQGNVDDRVRHGTNTTGERNGMATLTATVVRGIRRAVATGETQANVARRLRLSPCHVSDVVRRRRWNHV